MAEGDPRSLALRFAGSTFLARRVNPQPGDPSSLLFLWTPLHRFSGDRNLMAAANRERVKLESEL